MKAMQSIYLSAPSPRVPLRSESAIQAAAEGGLLAESHFLELRREVKPGKGENRVRSMSGSASHGLPDRDRLRAGQMKAVILQCRPLSPYMDREPPGPKRSTMFLEAAYDTRPGCYVNHQCTSKVSDVVASVMGLADVRPELQICVPYSVISKQHTIDG